MKVIRKKDNDVITQFSKLKIGETFVCVGKDAYVGGGEVFIKLSPYQEHNAMKLSDEVMWSIPDYRDVIRVEGMWVEKGATPK